MELSNTHDFRGGLGFVPDLNAEDLPVGNFTGGQNFILSPKGATKTVALQANNFVPTNNPHFLISNIVQSDDFRIFILGDDNVSFFSEAGLTDANPDGVTFNADVVTAPWSFTDLNGLLVFCNSGDRLQYLDTNDEVVALPNLATTTRFRRVVGYKNFLIGLGVSTDSGTTFNDSRLIWSAPAEPGAVPPDWDFASTSSRAGDNILASELDIRDAMVLGETLYIYKGDIIYAMEFTGGSFVFNFKPRFTNFGILTSNCVTTIDKRHFVVTEEDFRVHDGYESRAVGTDTIKDFFFNDLSKENFNRTFIVNDITRSHIYICYPSEGNTVPNKAIIWDWKRDKWGTRTFPASVNYGVYSQRRPTLPVTYETVGGTYEQNIRYDGVDSRNLQPQLFFLRTGNESLINESPAGRDLGQQQRTILERTALPLGTLSRDGVIRPDLVNVKVLGEIWVYAETDGIVQIQLGAQEHLNAPVMWGEIMDLDLTKSRRLDVIFASPYIAIRIISESPVFTLSKIEFRFALEGESYGFD